MPSYPQQRTLSIGGYTFVGDEIANLIYLYGSNTTQNWATLRLANASSGYQVPGGKTLYMRALLVSVSSGSVLTGVVPLYGDTDVGLNGNADPTNPVYLGDSISIPMFIGQADTNYASFGTSIDFTVPTGKYPAVKFTSAPAAVIVVCELK